MLPFVRVFIVLAAAASAKPGQGTPPAQAAGAGWRPTLTLGGYVQGELDAGAVGDSRFPSSDRFFLRRARLSVEGEVMPSLTYRVQAELAGGLGAANSVSATLTDGFLEWTKFAAAHVRFGQFKAPFGREWLVPSTELATVERTLATDRLTANRQIGADVSGTLHRGRVGYIAGIFNGNGRNTTVNDNARFMYIVRGTATPWQTGGAIIQIGANAYWSSDTRVSMAKDFGFDSTPETAGADNLFSGTRTGVGLDAHVERRAWTMSAEMLHVRFEQNTGASHPVVTSHGWYVEPGAFVHRRLVQVIGRYERFQPDAGISGNTTSTWTAGVSYYAHGTSVKLAADYLWVDAPDRPDAHQKLLAQIQAIF
jgi:phosphate-selective porin